LHRLNCEWQIGDDRREQKSSAKWLQLLIEAALKVRRVAVLWNPDNPSMVKEVSQMNDAARALTLDLTALPARGPELEASLAAIVPASVDGFVVCDDPIMVSIMPRLIVLAAERSSDTAARRTKAV
jgi:putative ABC transport system substrate-binding protein